MDYGILNFLGITLMMIFGLWAFQLGPKKRAKGNKEEPEKPRG